MPVLRRYIIWFFILAAGSSLHCNNREAAAGEVLFETLGHDVTGLHFVNNVMPTEDFNMFKYMYFYNGAGIGAGDFNNDGLTDLFFAANKAGNKLYINEGKLHFKDVTAAAAIPQDSAWSTGVSVVDINNDGLLDIYVCRVGNFEMLQSKNQLLVCTGIKNGIPVYEDRAAAYGLDFSGFSTQAAFFDYDRDGDLDMYLLNHSVHQNSSFSPRSQFMNTYSPLSGDRLYRNDSNRFTDITKQSGINSSEIGYGLGVAVSDINADGWPDLYVCNDFHENDYLYINQKNGTFADENSAQLMHTSKFSMGVDIADADNDGSNEIISTDMLAADPYILKRSLGDDDYDVFYSKIASGYNYQYSRNNLQYNRRNGMFSEAGLYAGVAATDWSWAPLWVDFDNDGIKDLFISNGIPKRLNDMDYINFIYNSEIQKKLQNNDMKNKDMALVDKFPEIKIPNKFFSNTGQLKFADKAGAVKNDMPTYSNGAVYADFDNDGDMDVVVNNINDPVLLYENKSAATGKKNYVSVSLTGDTLNRNAVGAKLLLFYNHQLALYEKEPVHGFLSSMEIPMHIGIGKNKIDSAFLVWPDNSYQPVTIDTLQPKLQVVYKKGLRQFDYSRITSFNTTAVGTVSDIALSSGLNYTHKENVFNEFDREPLLPHMLSAEGPALAVADINNDGLEDVFAGASRGQHNAVFIQQRDHKFLQMPQPALYNDSLYEDVDAAWADVNKDGSKDLIVVSGGNEYFGNDEHLQPRIYLNDGKGNLSRLAGAVTSINATASCVAVNDFNGDGFADIFIGGRAMPWNYGEIPRSWLLQNDGKGTFSDVTGTYAKELSKIGMVTDAVWQDMDKDGDQDLLVSCEWGGIYIFSREQNGFVKKQVTNENGWWNFVLPVDVDNDGDMDMVAGNLGLNSRLQASVDEPVRLYFNDFDDNGKKEQVVTFYVNHKEVTLSGKDELQKQMPVIKKNFIYAADFAKASLEQIFTPAKIKGAQLLQAGYFGNAVFINNGGFSFTQQPMPWQAQLSCYKDAVVVNANNDALPDILLAGNYYSNNIHKGRYDADYGNLLINKGNGQFETACLKGALLKGETRRLLPLQLAGQTVYVAAKNNAPLQVIRLETKK